jgi:hypothetical protein
MSRSLDLSGAQWEKSSYSGGDEGECVEAARNVIAALGVVPVRDSKDRHGPALVFPVEAWSAFIAGVKTGDFPTT